MAEGETVARPKVVVALLDETQEFQRLQAEDARDAAVEAGVDVEVVFAENNAIRQIQQLYKVIHAPEPQRPKAILVQTVSGDGLERVARAAVRAGIGWVLISRKVPYTEVLRQEHPHLPIGTVTADHVEIGRLQGRQFRALIPSGQGVVLYLQGPPDTSAAEGRLRGVWEMLAGTRIELKVIEGQWTESSGQQAVERWLRLKRLASVRPAVIGCQNDQMAQGARRALLAAGPEMRSVPLTGVDGLPNGGQRLVQVGELTATVVVPSSTGPAIRALAGAVGTGAPMLAELRIAPRSYPDPEQLAHGVAPRAANFG